jgi:hypothetical protein
MMLGMARLFPVIDRIFDGNLRLRLDEWREQGWSFQRIANELRDEWGVEVSDETVRSWFGPDGEAS